MSGQWYLPHLNMNAKQITKLYGMDLKGCLRLGLRSTDWTAFGCTDFLNLMPGLPRFPCDLSLNSQWTDHCYIAEV